MTTRTDGGTEVGSFRRNEHDAVRVNGIYAPLLNKPFSEPVHLAATRPNKRK